MYWTKFILSTMLMFLWTIVASQSMGYLSQISCSDSLSISKSRAKHDFEKLHLKLQANLRKWHQMKRCDSINMARCHLRQLPTTIEEKLEYRFTGALIAYYERKCFASVPQNLSLLQHLEKYAIDTHDLDKRAWTIEYQIAHCYAKLNDYDQAIYYYLKVIPGLQKRKELSHLTRLYGDLSMAYFYSNNYSKAEEYIQLGIQQAQSNIEQTSLRTKYIKLLLSRTDDTSRISSQIDTVEIYLNGLDQESVSMYYPWRQQLSLHRAELSKKCNQNKMALQFYHDALAIGNKINIGKISREQSKICFQIARLFARLGQSSQALNFLLKATQYLNPRIDSLPISSTDQYIENTFVDIGLLLSHIYYTKYQKGANPNLIDNARISINNAIALHKVIENRLFTKESILASSITTSELLKQAIRVEYEYTLQEINNDTVIRNILNLSKSNHLLATNNRISKIKLLNPEQRDYVKSIHDSLFDVTLSIATKGETDSLRKMKFEYNKIIHSVLPSDRTEYCSKNLKDYVEYFRGIKYYYFYSNHPEPQFHKLKSVEFIDSLATELYNQLVNNSDESKLKRAAVQLYKAIVPKNYEFPSICAIIAENPLDNVPFDVLIHNGEYLVHSKEFYYPPHIQFIGCGHEISHFKMDKILSISPNYPRIPKGQNAKNMGNKLLHLEYAKLESQMILEAKKEYTTQVENIPKTDLLRIFGSYDHIHFAGHASISNDTASLILSSEEGLYTITQNELVSLNANISSVFLSACETGLGKVQIGEGRSSLARAFIEGNQSKNVIYTLWSVDDKSTSTIISEVYKDNDNFESISLAEIKRSYIKHGNALKCHPYYWSGIQQTHFKLSKPNLVCKLSIVLFMLLLIAFLYYSYIYT